MPYHPLHVMLTIRSARNSMRPLDPPSGPPNTTCLLSPKRMPATSGSECCTGIARDPRHTLPLLSPSNSASFHLGLISKGFCVPRRGTQNITFSKGCRESRKFRAPFGRGNLKEGQGTPPRVGGWVWASGAPSKKKLCGNRRLKVEG